MAFMVYEKKDGNLTQTRENFSLAGYNLIYNLWVKRGKPTDQGWHMTVDDLIREHTEGKGSSQTYALLIDFHPNSRNRIGIIELLDIYAYTFSGESAKDASWSPMMLRLRDVLYEEYDKEITDKDKEQTIKTIKDPNAKEDFVEFLYLQGWNWGRNGMTNAAFIYGAAREYFRKFF